MLQQTSLLAEHVKAADQSQQAIYLWTNQVFIFGPIRCLMLQQTSLLAEHVKAADQSQQAIYLWTNQVPDAAAD